MAITNYMIIENEKQELAKEGKLQYTGRTFTVELTDGTEMIIPEVEDIHTYNKWKELGFQVRKGEKAIAKFQIWKYSNKKKKADEDDEESAKTGGYCFMKMAAFFSASQVDKIEEEKIA